VAVSFFFIAKVLLHLTSSLKQRMHIGKNIVMVGDV
jgi:hypothetical protein